LTDDLTNSGNDVQTVTYIFTPHIDPGDGGGECGDGLPVIISIEINPQPRIAVTADDDVLCYEGDAAFNVTNLNTVNAIGTWRYDVSVVYPGGVTGDWTAGLTNQTATGIAALTDDLTNTTNDVQTVTYTFSPHIDPGDGGGECGDGVPEIFMIYINPEPLLTVSVTDTIWCDSSTVNITVNDLTNSVVGTKVYQLESTDAGGNVVGVQLTGEYVAGLDIINQLINLTDKYQDIRYSFRARIKDTRPGHSGDYFDCSHDVDTTLTIHLNPTPRISNITLAKGELSDFYCNDSSITVNINSPTVPYQTGELYYNLTTQDSLVDRVWSDGNYPFSSGRASFDDVLHNNHDSDVLDVTYRFDPWIRDTRMIQDCHRGVDSSLIVHVAATLIPTAIPDTVLYGGWNISCYGYSDGQINLGVKGGFGRYPGGNYYYEWKTDSGSGLHPYEQNQDTLTAGIYTVKVTDINQCIGWDTDTLYQPKLLRVSWDSLVTNPCAGNVAGSVLVEVSGGTAPYGYTWTGLGETWYTQNLPPVPEGIFTLIVGDMNDCNYESDPPYQVQSAPWIGLTVDTSLYGPYHISCYGSSDGWIKITDGIGNGDIKDWYYKWTYPDGSIKEDTLAIFSLVAGKYLLELEDTAGCPYNDSIFLKEPAPIQFDEVTTTLYGGLYNISCTDSSDGNISLSVSNTGREGRTYTYLWNGPPEVSLNPTASSQNNIPAGTYSVSITDFGFGCQLDTFFVLDEPDPILANADTSDYSSYNIACYNGADGYIALNPSGGLGPYTYIWEPGTGGAIETPDHDSVYGLTEGSYNVTVIDTLNCSRSWTYFLNQPSLIQTRDSLTDYNGYQVSCSGGQNGEILALNPSGGVPGYTYLWSRTDNPSWSDTTETPSGIPADTLTVQVWDMNNCLYTDTIVLHEPTLLMVDTILSREISCNATNDGSARVFVLGGVIPYSYLWDDPLSTTIDTVINLELGWYNVLITDANGCTINDSIEIREPDPVIAQFTIISQEWYHGEMISCAGAADGAVWAQASGGRQPYTYEWLGTITMNDTIFGLAAGTHQVRIEDEGGCDTIMSVTLTEPYPLNAVGIIERNASCYNLNDGKINLEPRGGVSPYVYRWTSESLPADLTTEDIENLYAGMYNLTLQDMNYCHLDTSFIISEPDELLAEIIVDTIPFCPDSYDGMIHVNVTGGTEPYDIWWIAQNTNDAVLYNLGEGVYVVQVDDQNNCGLVGASVELNSNANNCLEIPTAISPNDDGKNDVWEIRGMEFYSDAIIDIYNRWGDLIFRSDRGYNKKFDGMYRGRHLPVDSYHFIINLNNGSKPILGNITIIL